MTKHVPHRVAAVSQSLDSGQDSDYGTAIVSGIVFRRPVGESLTSLVHVCLSPHIANMDCAK